MLLCSKRLSMFSAILALDVLSFSLLRLSIILHMGAPIRTNVPCSCSQLKNHTAPTRSKTSLLSEDEGQHHVTDTMTQTKNKLSAKNDLAAGEFLSFDYCGDFFHRHVPGSVTPPGCKRVQCTCGKNAVCPNDLERYETAVGQLLKSFRSSAHNGACRSTDRPR